MTASMLFRLILGVVLIMVGVMGKNFRVMPGTLWSKWATAPEELQLPMARWVGVALFVACGLGLIYLALRPLLWP